MAIENQIIANMHRAIEARDFDQIRAQEDFLRDLERAKQNGLIDYEVDGTLEMPQALIGNPDLIITVPQLRLLTTLSSRPNQVVGFAELKTDVWGRDVNDGAVHTAVSRLRKIVKPRGTTILNVKGKGYILMSSEDQAQK